MNNRQQSDCKNRRSKGVVIGLICGAIAVVLAVFILFRTGAIARYVPFPLLGNRELVVGTDIATDEITDFYYTYDTSTFPPDFQRYRFSAVDGTYLFYHEKREGDHWPLTEADITVSGSTELSEEEWRTFLDCVNGGTVRKRGISAEGGGSGPWLYLYWNGDRSEYQEFSFSSWEKKTAFEQFCVTLKDAQ